MFLFQDFLLIGVLILINVSPMSSWHPWGMFTIQDQLNDAYDFSGMNKIKATYQGYDAYRERYQSNRKMGNDFMDQHFYLCYHKDGTKTYYKKQDPRHFENRRYWVVSAKSGFVASMELC